MSAQVPATGGSGTAGIDPRGPRVGAGITAVLLAIAVILGDTAAGRVVLAIVVLSFAVGTAFGVTGTWQGLLYRFLVRPRLGPPAELEDPAPPRFAQTVGLVITALGLGLALAGVGWAIVVFGSLALAAAFLNAAFGFCLGCEMYLLLRRLRPATR